MAIKEFSIDYITSYVAIYYVTVLDHEIAIGSNTMNLYMKMY